jgi:hypothetical protein
MTTEEVLEGVLEGDGSMVRSNMKEQKGKIR